MIWYIEYNYYIQFGVYNLFGLRFNLWKNYFYNVWFFVCMIKYFDVFCYLIFFLNLIFVV